LARHKTGGGAQAILLAVAKLPWWIGVALALGFYLVLHLLAGIRVAAPAGTVKQMPVALGYTVGHLLAYVGQYVLPLLCVGGAIASAIQRANRHRLVDAAGRRGVSAIVEMSWQEFEKLVGGAFRMQGFDVIEKGGSQADGGVDLVLRKGHETFLVQCKHWKAMAAGVSIVRELYGVMAAKGAAGGFVVTSGRFTNDAVAFAKGRNIELIDGVALAKMLRLAACATDLETRPKSCEPMQAPDNATPPECPACGAPMIRRTARQGSHAGSQFFGCSRFPACRGIVSNR